MKNVWTLLYTKITENYQETTKQITSSQLLFPSFEENYTEKIMVKSCPDSIIQVDFQISRQFGWNGSQEIRFELKFPTSQQNRIQKLYDCIQSPMQRSTHRVLKAWLSPWFLIFRLPFLLTPLTSKTCSNNYLCKKIWYSYNPNYMKKYSHGYILDNFPRFS